MHILFLIIAYKRDNLCQKLAIFLEIYRETSEALVSMHCIWLVIKKRRARGMLSHSDIVLNLHMTAFKICMYVNFYDNVRLKIWS